MAARCVPQLQSADQALTHVVLQYSLASVEEHREMSLNDGPYCIRQPRHACGRQVPQSNLTEQPNSWANQVLFRSHAATYEMRL